MDKFQKSEGNGGKLYLEDGILYKFYDGDTSFNEEKARNVLYFKEHPLFSPKIGITFFEGDTLLGFSQEFIHGSRTFKDAIGDPDIKEEVRVKAVIGVFQKMKMLHDRGIFVGDMHSRNLILDSSDGYIVDLDEVRFKGEDDFKFEELYQIQMDEESPRIKVANEYTDNVKATVSALSLLYGFDFEDLVHDKVLRIDLLKGYIDNIISDSEFKSNVFKVLDSREPVIYFDTLLEKQNTNVKH